MDIKTLIISCAIVIVAALAGLGLILVRAILKAYRDIDYFNRNFYNDYYESEDGSNNGNDREED